MPLMEWMPKLTNTGPKLSVTTLHSHMARTERLLPHRILPPASARSLACTRSDAKEDVPPKWKKWAPRTLKEDNPPKESSDSSSDDEQLMYEALHAKVRQKVWSLDTWFDAWCHKEIAAGTAGWAT